MLIEEDDEICNRKNVIPDVVNINSLYVFLFLILDLRAKTAQLEAHGRSSSTTHVSP